MFVERLRDHFSSIRAVHGTRTDDVRSFYERGLLPLDPDASQQVAKDYFLGSGKFPELSETDLRQAFEAVGTNTRKGHVYFECNEPMLIALAGHYMLYGSEYLMAIAANLGSGRSRRYMRALQERGRPTLLIVDVPLQFVSHRDLMDFSASALSRLIKELVSGRDIAHGKFEGAAFSV